MLTLGRRTINFDSGMVEWEGHSQALTAKELGILKKLAENRGNIVTFDNLCQAVWGDDYFGYENTLMVHIRRLRAKIEEDPSRPVWPADRQRGWATGWQRRRMPGEKPAENHPAVCLFPPILSSC